MSNIQSMQEKLRELMDLPHEKEWVEFKEAKNNYDSDDLGRYFSALSNEANLNEQPEGWLLFGITNRRPRQIVGTNYRLQQPGLEKLKNQIAGLTNHQMTFRAIHELKEENKRVLLFEIPAAPPGIPTTWNGIAWGRIHESLVPLSVDKIEQIRKQAVFEDWSAFICKEATLNDLEPGAIAFGREQFKKKNHKLAPEVDQWGDRDFLNKSRVCIQGQITRAAIILFGRPEASHFLSSATARITWVLKDEKGQDYKHFYPPFILAVDQVFARIRNNNYRYLPNATLFPVEITQYDPWVIREVLHNSIAHQDYTKGGHINVVEEPDSLLFTNLGDFLPGSVEEVIRQDAPPELYRNRLLAEVMVNFNMIDTIGSGIKRMFMKQRERFFPLPDYDLAEKGRVKVRIFGKILDEHYSRVLIEKTDLDFWEVIALDKVQKEKTITDEEFRSLKRRGLVEGRRPNLYVSARIALATETKADYIRKRPFDKKHYMKMVQEYLAKFRTATRAEINELLIIKISDALSQEQKRNSITNLLQEMRRKGTIRPVEGKRGKGARWELYKSNEKG
jgi:ATP-dependent DNA helicase RecG